MTKNALAYGTVLLIIVVKVFISYAPAGTKTIKKEISFSRKSKNVVPLLLNFLQL